MNSIEPTIYVVDDEAEVRAALARLLRSAGWAVADFGAASEFMDNVPQDGIGCILLDVSMPTMSGPDLYDRLRERGVGLPVIYLTGNCTVSISVRAMKRGAMDFLEKPVDADILLPAIELAVQRCKQSRAKSTHVRDIDARLAALSVREREVLDQVITGRLNKQIAGDLGIAEKTVKVHRGRVMTKMRVRSVAELVHLCDERGIGRPLEPALN